jgi:hypothetical protein
MNEIKMVGMKTLGNTKLLTESRARVGVFASRDTDPAIDIIREQWAVRKKQLLVVSCFNCEHHSYATARYCRHLADMVSNSLVFWSKKEGSSLQPIYDRAMARGKRVECF